MNLVLIGQLTAIDNKLHFAADERTADKLSRHGLLGPERSFAVTPPAGDFSAFLGVRCSVHVRTRRYRFTAHGTIVEGTRLILVDIRKQHEDLPALPRVGSI